MPSARAQRSSWPDWPALVGGLADFATALRTPRGAAAELEEARELLAYWERRARRLPRWALMRRREARRAAWRWRERVRAAEQVRYGRGLLGAASQVAVERRLPTTVAHRGRQAARLALYTAMAATVTVLLVLAAALAVVAETVLSAF